MSGSEVFADGLLAGRVALVTGGGTGLGRATAAELLRCGASVVIAGRRADVLEATSAKLGEGAGYVAGDIRTEAGAQAIVDDGSAATAGSTSSSTTRAGSTSSPRRASS